MVAISGERRWHLVLQFTCLDNTPLRKGVTKIGQQSGLACLLRQAARTGCGFRPVSPGCFQTNSSVKCARTSHSAGAGGSANDFREGPAIFGGGRARTRLLGTLWCICIELCRAGARYG